MRMGWETSIGFQGSLWEGLSQEIQKTGLRERMWTVDYGGSTRFDMLEAPFFLTVDRRMLASFPGGFWKSAVSSCLLLLLFVEVCKL